MESLGDMKKSFSRVSNLHVTDARIIDMPENRVYSVLEIRKARDSEEELKIVMEF